MNYLILNTTIPLTTETLNTNSCPRKSFFVQCPKLLHIEANCSKKKNIISFKLLVFIKICDFPDNVHKYQKSNSKYSCAILLLAFLLLAFLKKLNYIKTQHLPSFDPHLNRLFHTRLPYSLI